MAPNGTGTSTSTLSTGFWQQNLRTHSDLPPLNSELRTTQAVPVTDRSVSRSSTGTSVLNLSIEDDRLKTFTNWPETVSFLDPSRLAAAGFFYLQKADLVRCIFCGIEIGKWEEGDDPMRDHQRWKPNCPFLKNQNVGNVPSGQGVVASSSTPIVQRFDTCGPYGIEVRPFSGPEKGMYHSLEKLGIHKSTGPMYKDHNSFDSRLRSYKLWPVSLRQKPNVLSNAGFYYTGKGDQTVCFHCGGGLKDWKDNDDPWVEHARWFPKCMYVLLVKGKSFVTEVRAKAKAELTSKDAKELELPCPLTTTEQTARTESCAAAAKPVSKQIEEFHGNGKSDEGRLCKICFKEDLGVVFLPCGHIVACVHCAPALSVCPVCCQPFMATVRAYLP